DQTEQERIERAPEPVDDRPVMPMEKIGAHIKVGNRVIDGIESGSPGLRETQNGSEGPKDQSSPEVQDCVRRSHRFPHCTEFLLRQLLSTVIGAAWQGCALGFSVRKSQPDIPPAHQKFGTKFFQL